MNEVTSKTCQMINLTLFNEREDSKWRPKPRSNLEESFIYGEDDKQAIQLVVDLTTMDKSQLIELLMRYKKALVWTLENMMGIDLSVSCHKLSINLTIKPNQQKKKKKEKPWD